MGVAEEEEVQILLLGGVAGVQQGLLHTIGVAVAEEDAVAPDGQQQLRGGLDVEIAVAGDLLQGDVREPGMEPLSVPPAVP